MLLIYEELRWMEDIRFIEVLDQRGFTLMREQQIILYLKHLVENVMRENATLKGEEYVDPWRTWNDVNNGKLPGFLTQHELTVLAEALVEKHRKETQEEVAEIILGIKGEGKNGNSNDR
jgi:hypothetical protein